MTTKKYFVLLVIKMSTSLFHIYIIVKGIFFFFPPGCVSNSDSGDDSTETQTSKFCEPSQGKTSNAKEGITFQVFSFSC